MRRSSFHAWLAPLLLFVTASACDRDTYRIPREGAFDGFASGPVSATSRRSTGEDWVFELSTGDTLVLTALPPRGLRIAYAPLGAESLELRSKGMGCFEGEDPTSRTVRFCSDPDWIELDARSSSSSLRLSLGYRDAGAVPALEEPADYSAEALAERALQQSFESRIQFERTVQSRLGAALAYRQLLPHFNAGTVLSAIGFKPGQLGSIVSLAGDLAPFLFPSRWLGAAQARQQARGDVAAYVLMKADAAYITSGIARTVLRDALGADILEAERREVSRLRDVIAGRERLGLLEVGASDHLTTVVHQLESGVLHLRAVVTTNLGHLSQSAGFANPRAVRSVIGGERLPGAISAPTEADLASAEQIAVIRSFELKQIDALIQEAKIRKKTRYLSWLDPSGDSAGSIGLGLSPYLAIGRSQVRELEITRHKIRESVLKRVIQAHQAMQSAGRAYALAARDAEVQGRRYHRLLDSLRLGMQVPVMDLVNVIQGKVRNEMDRLGAEHDFYAARDAWERLLYSGVYLGAVGE